MWLRTETWSALSLGSTPIRSPIAGVSAEAWGRFVEVMEVQPQDAVSDFGGLGCFAMRPKRLGDLDLMKDVRQVVRNGKKIWTGTFVLPMTRARFFGSPVLQYEALQRSMVLYAEEIASQKLPESVSCSGALAILHRGGPGALASWGKRTFSGVKELFEKANGIF